MILFLLPTYELLIPAEAAVTFFAILPNLETYKFVHGAISAVLTGIERLP